MTPQQTSTAAQAHPTGSRPSPAGPRGPEPAPEAGEPAAAASSEQAGESAGKRGVNITQGAVEFARSKLAKRGTPGAAIRLGIKGGGCSGFSYVIEFADDPPRSRDTVTECDGVRFYVDKKSLVYLSGSTLDYEKTLMFQGFKFRNPLEASRCGCGHSFTVR